MPTNEEIGSLVRRGILLFAGSVPIPGTTLIAAIAAAALAKGLDLRDRRISQVLATELELPHISYVEPADEQLLAFYRDNPLFPGLASEFQEEIAAGDHDSLREWYPYLYGALVLRRDIPALLFHAEIEEGRYRDLAVKYHALAAGYQDIECKAEVDQHVDHFARELLEVLDAVYGAARGELLDKNNRAAFELIDYIKELAVL